MATVNCNEKDREYFWRDFVSQPSTCRQNSKKMKKNRIFPMCMADRCRYGRHLMAKCTNTHHPTRHCESIIYLNQMKMELLLSLWGLPSNGLTVAWSNFDNCSFWFCLGLFSIRLTGSIKLEQCSDGGRHWERECAVHATKICEIEHNVHMYVCDMNFIWRWKIGHAMEQAQA